MEKGVKPDDIICNCKLNGVIAGLYVEDQSLAIEVETLFEAGPAPLLKILGKARKYVDVNGVKEIWIIVRDWAAALHLGDLYHAEHLLRKELGRQIKVLVPNLKDRTLEPPTKS